MYVKRDIINAEVILISLPGHIKSISQLIIQCASQLIIQCASKCIVMFVTYLQSNYTQLNLYIIINTVIMNDTYTQFINLIVIYS